MNTIWVPDLPETKRAKYLSLSDAITNGIRDGQLKPGGKLPPVRELAYRLGVTPGTVARAYSRLVDLGALEAVVGRGTFVAQPKAELSPLTAPAIEVDAVAHGTGGDSHEVNMISPHLPMAGQGRLIRQLLAEVAQDPPSGIMHYPSRNSDLAARAGVAKLAASVAMGQVRAEDVVLSHGGQNGIMLVLQSVLRGRKPVVLVEELAYTGFRRGAELLRADVISVPMDKDGMIPEVLEAAARAHEAQVVCVSPEIHNPTAGFMPLERREAVAKVARRCGLEILEDDCYRMSEAKTTAFRKLAPERTWYVGSISKWLTPALRLGYVIAPDGQAGLVRQTAETSYFGLATPMTDLFGKLLAHPDLPEMAENVRLKTRTYVEMVVNILGGYNLAWHADGLFFWLELPSGWRASAFCQAAAGQGVLLRAAEDYVGRGDPAPHAVRLAVNAGVGFSSYEAGILRLRDLLDNPPARMGV